MNKIRSKNVLTFAARKRFAWLAARLLNSVSEPLLNTPPPPRPYRALILNSGKNEFFQDIVESFRGDQKFELISWPSYALPLIAKPILDPSLRHDTYLTDNEKANATKVPYRQFLSSVWKYYQAISHVDVVISANFGYFVQREFATALEELGTPFIVLQKENLNAATPDRRKFWHSIYKNGRGRFCGRKILVYNEMEKDLEISADIAEPRRIEVVGMPRLDRLHHWRQKHAGAQPTMDAKVLFFSFSRVDKLPSKAGLVKDWGDFCISTHRAMLELARARPELTIDAKTKGITRQDTELLQMLDSATLPPNFRIVSGGDPFDLIAESRVVVGFNTSGLLEALALGKPVIVPRFGEALDPVLQSFVIDLDDSVQYADSPEHLKDLISLSINRPLTIPLELSPAVKKVLRHWVGNDDGHAGRRAYGAICKEVVRK